MKLAALLALLATAIAAALLSRARRQPDRPNQCGDRTWLPYEDDDGFGYCEWVCQLPPGHAGRHEGWLNERRDMDRPQWRRASMPGIYDRDEPVALFV